MFHAAPAEPPHPRGSRRIASAGASPSPAADARGEVVPVAGLGEEAYFVGTAVYGALYVLHDDLYFRVSTGGPGDLAAKLDRARALARHVISKLPV